MSAVLVDELGRPGDDDLDDLAALLVECVAGGAGVGFLHPLGPAQARAWWETVLATADARTWVARDGEGRVVGCVRLVPATMPNSPHRAEVSKLLVSPRARRNGTATALLAALESWAAAHGRTTLVLDTETGSPAQSLYERLGWQHVGDIPDYAYRPDGTLASTTVLTKRLGAGG